MTSGVRERKVETDLSIEAAQRIRVPRGRESAMEKNFRAAGPFSGTYHKAAAVQTAFAAVIYLWARLAAPPPPNSAAATAFVMGLLLVLLSIGARLGLLGNRPSKEAAAATLLPLAAATIGALFGAAYATGNGLYLLAGFLLGVGYVVYALIRNIDEIVAPSRLLLISLAQVALLFFLLG